MSNLTQRILTALIAAPVAVGLTFLGGWFFGGFVLVVALLAQWDLYGFATAAGIRPLKPETLDDARRIAPGFDVHALEAEWRGFWAASGRPALRSPDAAFLGWLKGRVAR